MAGPRAVDEGPIPTLERWERQGGVWRVRWRHEREAAVDLLTCFGEPAGEVRSGDPALLAYLSRRASSEAASP